MAKYEARLRGNFNSILEQIDDAVGNSATASLEEKSSFTCGNARCAVRIYERYSMTGSNRVSLSVTLFESDGQIFVSAATSGGSQAMFFKINTWGEEAFLDTIRETLEQFRI